MLTPAWAADELVAYLGQYPNIPDNISIAVVTGFALAERFPCETRT